MQYKSRDKPLISVSGIADSLLADLDTRDVALWIRDFPTHPAGALPLLAFLGLPWRLVLSEAHDPAILAALDSESHSNLPMTRKRGLVQVIEQDPSRIELPQRCLPFYVLPRQDPAPTALDFESQLRSVTMLEALRRSGARQLLLVSVHEAPVPPSLTRLFASGFRAHLTFVADRAASDQSIFRWLQATPSVVAANLATGPVTAFLEQILDRYAEVYPDERRVIRVRNQDGKTESVDVTDVDEPERPVLQSYTLIEERDLRPLLPAELSDEEFTAFFANAEASWRPYAAGLPWMRTPDTLRILLRYLAKLDTGGANRNCIAFVAAESGAGGTTLARTLAWESARHGYPVLIAKPLPFVPDALPVRNFLKRAHEQVHRTTTLDPHHSSRSRPTTAAQDGSVHRYQTPGSCSLTPCTGNIERQISCALPTNCSGPADRSVSCS